MSIRIDPLSCCSLRLEMLTDSKSLGKATGFTVQDGNAWFLITNWHVLSGRNPETNQPCHPSAGLPDKVIVTYPMVTPTNTWDARTYDLFSRDGRPVWVEHERGGKVDVVAFPLGDPGPKFALRGCDLNL